MWRSKKIWMFISLAVVLTVAGWWLITRHTAPGHARYITKDALAVVTINTKRLAGDLLWGGDLKADTNTTAAHKFKDWRKAFDETGWAGINPTADLLFFSNMSEDGKQVYYALIVKLDDALKLNTFLSNRLPNLLDSLHVHATNVIDNKSYQSIVIVNDDSETPVCIGFNKEVAVLLKAGTPATALSYYDRELKRIFSLTSENSVLGDKNYVSSQKKSADVACWINMGNANLLKLLSPAKQPSPQAGYLNAWLNFNKGEVTLDMLGTSKEQALKPVLKGAGADFDFSKLNGKDKLMGMAFFNLNLPALFERMKHNGKNDLCSALEKQTGITETDITSAFTGQMELSMCGFITYVEKYKDYEYDADFNRTEIEKERVAHLPGMVIRLGITNPAFVAPLVPKLLSRGLIIPFRNGFQLKGPAPVYMLSSGNNMFITTFQDVPKETNNAWNNADLTELHSQHGNGAFVNFQGIREAMEKDLGHKPGYDKLSKVLENMTWAIDEESDGSARSRMVLHFTDKKTNSLTQLLRLTAESVK
ncbi:MAG: DUF4836 family protein [Bacteroidia bacterium]